VDDDTVTGLVMSAETLAAGPEAVVECMRHEATHILCWVRGIKDTTMHGGYHNSNFVTVADELGLVWPEGTERGSSRGYSAVKLCETTLAKHAPDVKALAEIIPSMLHRLTMPAPADSPRRPGRLTLKCQCLPPRKLMISKTVADKGPIDCRICGAEFAV
jgi:hypothetical protein